MCENNVMSRKKLGSLLGAVVILILISIFGDPRDLLPADNSVITSTSTYQVIKVVDGDTITIDKDGERVSVRLIGVDTPETVDPRRPVECFGQAATDEVRRIIGNKAVRLTTDTSQGERDTYGRLLAYVYADDIFINQHLIAEGFGHEYTYIRSYAYQDAFRAAEREAEEERRGLWAPSVCN